MDHPPDRISGGSFSCRLGIHREAPIKSATNFGWVREHAFSHFDVWVVATSLPFGEGSFRGCLWSGAKDGFSALFEADKCGLVCWYAHESK